MAFTGDPIGGGGSVRGQTRRRASSRAAQREEPSQVHPTGRVPREQRIALLPGQTEDTVAPLKLLQLLMYAKSTAHETLVYNPATGSSSVNPKAGGSTPLHSWRGVYPTPEAALLAALKEFWWHVENRVPPGPPVVAENPKRKRKVVA